MKSDRKIFLYAITGLSPAVLTETIWCLATQESPIFPDRIVVFTTQRGREELLKWVDMHWKNMIGALKKRKLEIPYYMESWQSGWINVFDYKDESGAKRSLDDIRSQRDNLEMAEYMFRQIKSDIRDEEVRPVIYASIAGGRKTMGAMLHSIISLVGREGDKIFHVLTDREPPRDFAYPGCKMPKESETKSKHPERKMAQNSDIKLDFAEVPFVPLYNVLKRNKLVDNATYKSLIQDLSDSINGRLCKVKLSARDCVLSVEIGDNVNEVKLRYVEFLIASTFFRRAKLCRYTSEALLHDDSYDFEEAAEGESEYESDLRAEYNRVKSKIKKEERPSTMNQEDIRQLKGDLRRKLKQYVARSLVDLLIPVKKTYSEIPPENIEFVDYK